MQPGRNQNNSAPYSTWLITAGDVDVWVNKMLELSPLALSSCLWLTRLPPVVFQHWVIKLRFIFNILWKDVPPVNPGVEPGGGSVCRSVWPLSVRTANHVRPNLIRVNQQEGDLSLITLPHMLRSLWMHWLRRKCLQVLWPQSIPLLLKPWAFTERWQPPPVTHQSVFTVI